MANPSKAHRRRRRTYWSLAVLILWAWGGSIISSQPAETPAPDKPSEFLRFVKTADDEGHVDTAIVTYRRDGGASVSLVAAVHIADGDYFRKLQGYFTNFEAVLYEMVKPKQSSATNLHQLSNPIRAFQVGMKRLLELEFQLDAIDYSPTNFVHADLDTETFSRLQKDQGESILGLMIRAALAEQNQRALAENSMDGWQFLFALLSPDSAHKLKFLFASQLAQVEQLVAGIDQGQDGQGSVLVSGRNRVVMEVLDRQMRQGRKQLAIFYGAGHMADLERRLLQIGFRKVTEQWITAWDIRPKKTSK